MYSQEPEECHGTGNQAESEVGIRSAEQRGEQRDQALRKADSEELCGNEVNGHAAENRERKRKHVLEYIGDHPGNFRRHLDRDVLQGTEFVHVRGNERRNEGTQQALGAQVCHIDAAIDFRDCQHQVAGYGCQHDGHNVHGHAFGQFPGEALSQGPGGSCGYKNTYNAHGQVVDAPQPAAEFSRQRHTEYFRERCAENEDAGEQDGRHGCQESVTDCLQIGIPGEFVEKGLSLFNKSDDCIHGFLSSFSVDLSR